MVVGIVPNPEKDNVKNATLLISEKLSKLGVEFYVDQQYADKLQLDLPVKCGDLIYKTCDIIIAVGGDGTMIRVAKEAAFYSKPVLGVNSGRTGYMAGIELNELDLLEKLTSGDYSVETRMMLTATVSSQPDKKYYCLNDIVISKGAFDFAFDVTLYNNQKEFMSLRADGLIASTPTGSTAYAMSAGGPITDPSIECMILVPICPISLYSRGVILSGDSKISLRAKTRNGVGTYVVFDGRDGICLKDDEYLSFCKTDDVNIKLIRIKNESFFGVLKNKINCI